ncbi:Immunoglobulin-like domain [Sergentomyia squamirostris]
MKWFDSFRVYMAPKHQQHNIIASIENVYIFLLFSFPEVKANILGPSDLYVKSGSDINLICRLSHRLLDAGYLFWYKDAVILEAAINANEISSDISKRITVDTDWSDGLTSRVTIRRAVQGDTGNYTCSPSIAASSSVYVHVIIGEHPAAMQHNSASTVYTTWWCTKFLACVLLVTLGTSSTMVIAR